MQVKSLTGLILQLLVGHLILLTVSYDTTQWPVARGIKTSFQGTRSSPDFKDQGLEDAKLGPSAKVIAFLDAIAEKRQISMGRFCVQLSQESTGRAEGIY